MADDIKQGNISQTSEKQKGNVLDENGISGLLTVAQEVIGEDGKHLFDTCLADWRRGGSISLHIAGEDNPVPLSEIVYRIRKKEQLAAAQQADEALRYLNKLAAEELVTIWCEYLMPQDLSPEQQIQWIKSMTLSMHQGSALLAFTSVFNFDLFSVLINPVEGRGTRKIVLSMDEDKRAVICEGNVAIVELLHKNFPENPCPINPPLQLHVTYELKPNAEGSYNTEIREFKLSLGDKDLSNVDPEAIKELQKTFLLCCQSEGALPRAESSAISRILVKNLLNNSQNMSESQKKESKLLVPAFAADVAKYKLESEEDIDNKQAQIELQLCRAIDLNSRPWWHFLWLPLLFEKWRNEREIARIFDTVKEKATSSVLPQDRNDGIGQQRHSQGELAAVERQFEPNSPPNVPESISDDKDGKKGEQERPYP